MASFSDQSSFTRDSPDSGIDFETIPQNNKLIQQHNELSQHGRNREQQEAILEKDFTNQMGFGKFENPLSEPIVRLSLQKVKISGIQLMNMSVKELNKRLVHCPPFIVAKLKKCRRTLKNRGYAKNCRIKRIAMKNRLEEVNNNLLLENRELRQHNKSLTDQLNHLLGSCHNNAQHQNIVNFNQVQHHNQRQEVVEDTNNFNQLVSSVGSAKLFNNQSKVQQQQQQLIQSYETMTPTTSINTNNIEYNQTYPTSTVNETYYSNNLESELDYLAEQLALDQ